MSVPSDSAPMRVALELGEYAGATFDDLIAAVVDHNAAINKGHLIKERKPHRVSVICSTGADKCDFRAYGTSLKGKTGIRVTRFSEHTCREGTSRARKGKPSILSNVPKAVSVQCGKYPGTTFDDLIIAVVQYNAGINKSHRIKERKPHRVSVICSAGTDKCEFRAYGTIMKGKAGIQVTRFAPHTCSTGPSRARQMKSSLLSNIAPAVNDFVPGKKRAGSSARKLQEMVKKQAGVELKAGQAHSIVKKKRDGAAQQHGQPSRKRIREGSNTSTR